MSGLRILGPDERLSERRGAKIAIFGPPGVGKTSLLRTLDRMTLASTLLLDLEAGDLAIAGLPVASIRPTTWEDCRDIAVILGGANPALAASSPYSETHYRRVMSYSDSVSVDALTACQILFVDSLSEAARLCRTWCEQQSECFTPRGVRDQRAVYGALARELVAFLQQLQHARERTIVFVGVLERVVDDSNVAMWRLQLEGQRTAAVLPAVIDEVITMQWIDFGDGKPAARSFVCSNPNRWNFPGKDRSGRLEQIEEPNLQKLLNKLLNPATTGD